MTSATRVFRKPESRATVLAAYDELLAGWPLPSTRRHVSTRHGATFVLSSGPEDGPPVLLLHGSASNSAMWLGDVAPLARAHRVHCVDILGEPGHSDEVRLPLDGLPFVEWMEDVLAGLGCPQASLVGCSLGGWIALKLATARPERVDRLALLCPSGVAPPRASFLFWVLLLLPLGSWGQRRLNRIVWGGLPVPAEVERFGSLILRHFRPRTGALPTFGDAEMGRLAMPTLLIAGERDALLPSRKTAERLRRLVPHADIRLRPDAGHVLLDTGPELQDFLEEASREAAA